MRSHQGSASPGAHGAKMTLLVEYGLFSSHINMSETKKLYFFKQEHQTKKYENKPKCFSKRLCDHWVLYFDLGLRTKTPS